MSGTSGTVLNSTVGPLLAGDGGDAGAAVAVSLGGGLGTNIIIGDADVVFIQSGVSVTGATSNGGAGGSTTSTTSPVVISGGTGASTVQSSATDTGATGDSTSTATASPVSASGHSGRWGHTGAATESFSVEDAD